MNKWAFLYFLSFYWKRPKKTVKTEKISRSKEVKEGVENKLNSYFFCTQRTGFNKSLCFRKEPLNQTRWWNPEGSVVGAIPPLQCSWTHQVLVNQRLFVSSAQNDHPASEGQAEDPAEQSPGVPSEIHAAVFLNRRSRMTTFAPPPREGGGDVANRCKMRQPAWVYLSLICAFFRFFWRPR